MKRCYLPLCRFSPLRRFLLLICLSVASIISANAQTTYTWTGASLVSPKYWSDRDNWTTGTGGKRNSPSTTDILIFDGSVTGTTPPAVVLDVTQTINRLVFRNNVVPTITPAGGSRTLTIVGDNNINTDDFQVNVNTAVILNASGNDGISINLTSNGVPATGSVSGIVFLTNSAGSGAASHSLTATAGNGLVFESGSELRLASAGLSATNKPFGTNSGTVRFVNGSTFTQGSGADPFPAATFANNSTYDYLSGALNLAGYSVGNFKVESSSATVNNLTGASPFTIRGDLLLTSSTNTNVVFNLEVRLLQNLQFDAGSGANLTFSNAQFLGTQEQIVFGNATGNITFTSLTLNNSSAAGVTLQKPIRVNNNLSFTDGNLNTSSTAMLTMPSTAVTNGNVNSFVNGPVQYDLQTASQATLVYPIGKGTTFRPLTLVVTPNNASSLSTYSAEQIEGRAPNYPLGNNIARVSRVRYYQINKTGPASNGNNPNSVTLSYGADDGVDDTNKLRIARSNNGGNWTNAGGGENPGIVNSPVFLTGTVTSNTGINFANNNQTIEFALATSATEVNPLPVELARFTAVAQPKGVLLNWATASEKNSATFEVERSADGREFTTIASVKAQGNSNTWHDYQTLDAQPLPGLAYYRLRQIDIDGTPSLSNIVTVRRGDKLEAPFYPNPARESITLAAGLGEVQYRVLNTLGQTVLTGKSAGGLSVDIQALPVGTYVVELNAQGQRTVQRLIHQN